MAKMLKTFKKEGRKTAMPRSSKPYPKREKKQVEEDEETKDMKRYLGEVMT